MPDFDPRELSTEKLDSLIEKIPLDGPLNMEYLNILLTEREQREDGQEVDVQKAWNQLSRRFGKERPAYPEYGSAAPASRIGWQKWNIMRKVATVAAVIALLMVLTVSASAIAPHFFWGRLERDEEHFSFGDAQYSDEPQEANVPLFENWDEDKVYGSLQEVLDDFGITEVTEPTWLPEGYEFDDASAYCIPEGNVLWIYGGYSRGEKQMTIAVEYAPPGEHHNTQYQVTDDPYEEYTIGDYTFLQFSNLKTKKILWLTPNYECSVTGYLTFDELKMIVDSIYLEG